MGRLLPFALLPLLPLAGASTDDLPTGGGAPDADESIEETPGIVYGALVLVGTVVVAVALAWAVHRQKRQLP